MTTDRNCDDCAHTYCSWRTQRRDKGCRLFKGTAKKKPERADRTNRPVCSRTSCNRNIKRRCEVLTDNDFGGKPCPFYRKGEKHD